MGVVLDHDEELSHRYRCHQPRLLSKLLVKLPDRQRRKNGVSVFSASAADRPDGIDLRTNSRVVHEVVDLPHGHASHVHEEDQTEQHQVVLWRHPQHKLQVEGIELRQKELE